MCCCGNFDETVVTRSSSISIKKENLVGYYHEVVCMWNHHKKGGMFL